MDAASNQVAPGDLRVSDADRDRAVGALSEHYQAGRLTLEEFDERSGQALQARTARELTGLFTDLPTAQALTPSMGQAVGVPETRPHLPVARVIVAAAAIAALAIVLSVLARTGLAQHIGGPRRGFGLPVPLFVLFFVVVRLLGWRRWRRRGGGQPGGPVQDR